MSFGDSWKYLPLHPSPHHKPLPLLLLREALFKVLVQRSALFQAAVQAIGFHALHHAQLHGTAFIVVLGIRDGTRHVREDVTQERLRRHLKGRGV